MTIEALFIKRNDLQPYYPITISDVPDLTGAAVLFTMVNKDTGNKKVNRAAAVITDAAAGEIEYQWKSGDTDTAGNFLVEFEITPQAGGKFTVPNSKETAKVTVTPDLDEQ